MANDHWVQRGLLKYWSTETAPGQFDNMVNVFDFSTKTMRRRSTRSVFAREGLNAPHTEAEINRLFERPLSIFVQNEVAFRRAATDTTLPDTRVVNDWKTMRAVALSCVMQGARSLDALAPPDEGSPPRASVSRLVGLKEPALNVIAEQFLKDNRVGTFALPNSHRVVMPEAGWYSFPVLDAHRGFVWAWALPLTPQMVLFAAPVGVEVSNSPETIGSIAMFSVGMGPVNNKVVVPSGVVAPTGAAAQCAELTSLREHVESLRDQIERARRLVFDMYASCGLPAPRTRVG